MGACDSVNNINRIDNANQNLLANNNNPEKYTFQCNEKYLLNKKSFNLEFTFFDIKVKHCISHSPSRNSIYATEIQIGKKLSKLYINQGKNPIINLNTDDIKIKDEFKINDLKNTYLSINVYEFTDDMNININSLKQGHILSNEYKTKSKYNSFININLISFLFKSKKCDFLMKGQNQLSSNTRISFICDIKHREKIKIVSKSIYADKICKLNYKYKDNNLGVSNNVLFVEFSLDTPLITMKELQEADLFLETNEKETPYKYITLNDLKFLIIKNCGQTILKEETDSIEYNPNNLILNQNNNLNNKSKKNIKGDDIVYCGFSEQNDNSEKEQKKYESKKEANLALENLPMITQISTLYFTECGHLYNTSLLNILNDDKDINEHRKNSKISSDDFYIRLKKIYENLNKGNFDFNTLCDDLNDVLRRSVDNEKFYFLYPNLESLNKMIILMMCIGIKIIEYIHKINEEQNLIILLKIINNLIKREELDNGVLCHCLNQFNEKDPNIKLIYNNFFIKLLKLNEYCRIKKLPSLNNSLIDLYSRLYFKKRYIREAIFNTLWNKETNYDNYQIDVFIYDKLNDEKLNQYLDQNAINQIIKKNNYFANLFSEGNIFFKNIIYIFSTMNINEFPFDFSLFTDNSNILKLLSGYIKNKKIENLGNEFFEITAYLAGSYKSINIINEQMIQFTNGYNNLATFKLLDYLKSLLEYYYSTKECKMIMDYSLFEKAIMFIIKIDSSISLPKLLWLYYCNSHLITSGHLKYFIINICNMYFKRFAYHWSFSVRQVFFKLCFFIFNERIKNDEGKVFNIKNISNYEKKNANEKLNNNIEALKDFQSVSQEFKEWEKAFKNTKESLKIVYPPLLIPNPNNPDNIDPY